MQTSTISVVTIARHHRQPPRLRTVPLWSDWTSTIGDGLSMLEAARRGVVSRVTRSLGLWVASRIAASSAVRGLPRRYVMFMFVLSVLSVSSSPSPFHPIPVLLTTRILPLFSFATLLHYSERASCPHLLPMTTPPPSLIVPLPPSTLSTHAD
jgi:hypothetical protein